MAAILGIVAVMILAVFFLFFRAAGRMGQAPSPQERARHTMHESPRPGPRATGLN